MNTREFLDELLYEFTVDGWLWWVAPVAAVGIALALWLLVFNGTPPQ